ncbi:MAG: hypothetical protein WCH39_21875, partial [Schlesneria sp.]
ISSNIAAAPAFHNAPTGSEASADDNPAAQFPLLFEARLNDKSALRRRIGVQPIFSNVAEPFGSRQLLYARLGGR